MMVAFCIPCSQRGMVQLGAGTCDNCVAERDSQEMRLICADLDARKAWEAQYDGVGSEMPRLTVDDVARRLLADALGE